MRDQAFAEAASNAHQPYRRLAKNATPKNAKATPVCPEGNEWYLLLSNRSSRPCHKPFHSCVASVLLGRARPVRSRKEVTTAPEMVAAIIIQSRILQTNLLRVRQARPNPMHPKSINSGQSPQLLRNPATSLTDFNWWAFTH